MSDLQISWHTHVQYRVKSKAAQIYRDKKNEIIVSTLTPTGDYQADPQHVVLFEEVVEILVQEKEGRTDQRRVQIVHLTARHVGHLDGEKWA